MKESKKTMTEFIRSNYDTLLELFNCINVGIYITDEKGITLLVNDESVKTGGLGREALVGESMVDLVKIGYVTESASLKAIESGKVENIVQQLSDGGQVYISGTPLLNGGVTDVVICTERDITETIKLHEILKEKDRMNQKYKEELEFLRKQNSYFDQNIIAQSKEMCNVIDTALRISKWETTVLITGESGTGKEVMANLIYKNSQRSEKPFIKVNCSAIPENLIESEFFGYEAGAFTGAGSNGKPGFFELANGGTLFLDEIGELLPPMQSKLLRAIQEREVMRIGGKKIVPIDVRLIAATNINLKKAITEGKFREDLFYRLNIIPIEIPPLRNRKEDIMHLAISFVDQFNAKYSQKKMIHKDAVQALLGYDWPGNIRELKNIIERIILTMDGDEITRNHVNRQIYFDMPSNVASNEKMSSLSLQAQIEQFERNLIKNMLMESSNAYEVSKKLKVNRSTISKKIKKYGIEIEH